MCQHGWYEDIEEDDCKTSNDLLHWQDGNFEYVPIDDRSNLLKKLGHV